MGNCCGNGDHDAAGGKNTVDKTEENGYFPDKEIVEEPEVTDPLGNERMEAKWTEVQEIIAAGEKWTDPEFPPNMSSLINQHHDNGNVSSMRQVEWKRATDIFDSPAMYTDGINPNDIKQGALGDCYYLACLSSMAERPEQVMARFVNPEINDAGIYLLSLYVNGVKTPVVVDDWIPCKNDRPCFARSNDGELWVCLLEKAWAKLYGTYVRMEGGDPAFAATHLNGAPAQSHWHRDITDPEEFYAKIKYADDRNYTLMSGSHGQGEQQLAKGVISGHAYSLIAIHEFEHEGSEVRLLKMRNPWGSSEWTGAWSDNSSLWTDELREQLDSSAEEDGVFFIPFEDYIRHFATTSICVNNDPEKYFHSYCMFDFGSNGVQKQTFTFELTEPVPADEVFTISVAQQGPRLKCDRLRQGAFNPAAIKIMLYSENGGNWIEAQYMRAFNNWMEVDDADLEAGAYKVVVEIPQWNACANQRSVYKQVCVDIFCTQENIDIQPAGE